jgi:hypothetical protein
MARAGRSAETGRLVGYARVSTEEQGTDPQLDELRAAGCHVVHEERASGADRSRSSNSLRAKARISAACAIRSIPPHRRACSRSRCWVLWHTRARADR